MCCKVLQATVVLVADDRQVADESQKLLCPRKSHVIMSLDMEISESSGARVYDDTGVFLIVL